MKPSMMTGTASIISMEGTMSSSIPPRMRKPNRLSDCRFTITFLNKKQLQVYGSIHLHSNAFSENFLKHSSTMMGNEDRPGSLNDIDRPRSALATSAAREKGPLRILPMGMISEKFCRWEALSGKPPPKTNMNNSNDPTWFSPLKKGSFWDGGCSSPPCSSTMHCRRYSFLACALHSRATRMFQWSAPSKLSIYKQRVKMAHENGFYHYDRDRIAILCEVNANKAWRTRKSSLMMGLLSASIAVKSGKRPIPPWNIHCHIASVGTCMKLRNELYLNFFWHSI